MQAPDLWRGVNVMPLFALTLMVSAASLEAQLPAAATLLPAGFTLKAEQNLGGTVLIDAVKPNEDVPKPHRDPRIELRISWQLNPMADMILDMSAKQPEEPTAQVPGSVTREEPCGISRHRDGVLTCRKVITPWVGSGKGPDLVTLRIGWMGKGQDGLVSISVNQFCGSKASAMAWVDTLIPKITKAR